MKLFDKKMMVFKDIKDWKEVVHEGVRILVENQKATWDLEKAIMESTAQFGAYYVLEKGIALLHAPVGAYCVEAAASILLLHNYVTFNNQEDKQAKIIVTLSAPNSNDHIDLISQFANYFGNQEFKKEAYQANSVEHFLDIVKKYEV
ncbi:PTS sugar transporter subunit IIA [Mesomycoplasma conjunctivae]|uniref:PTS sugar transporter subunit IIA n=1 Tax=Mesomycoplasma conjunctivae TaxID=45361 RepID=UPI003DA466E6